MPESITADEQVEALRRLVPLINNLSEAFSKLSDANKALVLALVQAADQAHNREG